jgi:hypothetical protein
MFLYFSLSGFLLLQKKNVFTSLFDAHLSFFFSPFFFLLQPVTRNDSARCLKLLGSSCFACSLRSRLLLPQNSTKKQQQQQQKKKKKQQHRPRHRLVSTLEPPLMMVVLGLGMAMRVTERWQRLCAKSVLFWSQSWSGCGGGRDMHSSKK